MAYDWYHPTFWPMYGLAAFMVGLGTYVVARELPSSNPQKSRRQALVHEYVHPSALVPSHPLVGDKEDVSGIEKFIVDGWDTDVVPPIEVVEYKERNEKGDRITVLYVLNGHRRLRAAMNLKLKVVPVVHRDLMSRAERAAYNRQSKAFQKLHG